MQKVRNCFKGKLALLLVCALVVGMLPAGSKTTAAEAATSEANTARSGYGLNNPSTDSNGITTWDCVWFGNYPQSDATGAAKDPIKWRVLSVNGDDVFLLADQNLYCQRYNDTNTSVTWETCTMRSWLNSTFLNKAFNATEQAAIQDTTVVNEDNPYGTEGGNNTTDKVYLLSISEVLNPGYGFVSDPDEYAESRQAKNTAYAKEQGAWTCTSEDYAGNGGWWLRSPGSNCTYASIVDYDGYVNQFGHFVNFSIYAVRPALHLNLSSTSVWSYAGQVISEGGETVTVTPPPTATPISTAISSPSGHGLNNPSADGEGVTTWDCVWFGNYPQSNAAGVAKDPIKWRVLSVNGDDTFLLADQNLDCQRYNDTCTDVTWETCTMRTWLNDSFLNKAFNATEQAAIRNTTVVNEDNPEWGTEGGNNTTDKVYLLSISEVLNPGYGFTPDHSEHAESRQAKNTEYAKKQGAYTYSGSEYAGNGAWWLRSSGYDGDNASDVLNDGCVLQGGFGVSNDSFAVRPALHLNLSSTLVWSYAGKVTSEEGEVGTETPAPAPTASPVQTASPAGTAPSIQNPAVPSSAPAQDLTEKTGEDETAPAKVTALKLKAKKKALQASWKKVSGASGYQVWCSTSKKFQKKSVKTTKKTKLTIGKRKAKQVYFVKVRAYMVKSGKKVYGAWSKTMKKKVK